MTFFRGSFSFYIKNKLKSEIENNYNPSTNPFLFLVELSFFCTRAFSKLHFFLSLKLDILKYILALSVHLSEERKLNRK